MTRPIQVLHVVHRMGRGGIETWLMNVLRSIDRTRFQFTFMVYTTDECAYDAELQALGARLVACAPPTRPAAYLRDLTRILFGLGPFDVVHTHGSAADGVVLRAAAQAGVPIRIMHSHNAGEGRRRLRSYGYRLISRQWMRHYMTHGFGCSEAACRHLFGANWQTDQRCAVLYYGINWQPFREPVDVHALRATLGLPPDALVVGHVGRFHPQKNHRYLVEIARQIAAQHEQAYFLLVGAGELKTDIAELVRRHGLRGRFVFAGLRSDIPALLQAMDVFLFPSHYEGLPIALLEAQTAGLPCVVSTSITPETTLIADHMQRVSLASPPATWAAAVLDTAGLNRQQTRQAALQAIASSKFSLSHGIDRLTQVYEQSRETTDVNNEYAIR